MKVISFLPGRNLFWSVISLMEVSLGCTCSVGEGSRIRPWEPDLCLLLKPVTTARSDRKPAKTPGETFLQYEIRFGIHSTMKALLSLLPLKAALFLQMLSNSARCEPGPDQECIPTPPPQLPVYPHFCHPWHQDRADVRTMNQSFSASPSKWLPQVRGQCPVTH